MSARFNFLGSNFLAQLVHFFAGWALGLSIIELAATHGHEWLWLLPVFLGGILLKEAWLDPAIETNQPFFWAGFEDFVMYVPGVLVAVALAAWLFHVL